MDEEFISLSSAASSNERLSVPANNAEISSRFKNIHETRWLPLDNSKTKRSPPLIQLHNEIISFYNFVEPTEEEMHIRALMLAEISDIIHELFPGAIVQVFG